MDLSSDFSSIRNSDSRVFLVTGANGAIGRAIARQLAETPVSEIVLLCRNKIKAEQAVKEIVDLTGNTTVRFEFADLSRDGDIKKLYIINTTLTMKVAYQCILLRALSEYPAMYFNESIS